MLFLFINFSFLDATDRFRSNIIVSATAPSMILVQISNALVSYNQLDVLQYHPRNCFF